MTDTVGWHASFLAKAARHLSVVVLTKTEASAAEGNIVCYAEAMTYVYLLRSIDFPHQSYLGCTNNLKSRLTDHNAGRSPHTARYRPWGLVCYTGFADEAKARSFEQYLKSGSGRAFRNRHLF
jgi:putative endonuclease